jgi:hypothetical protein
MGVRDACYDLYTFIIFYSAQIDTCLVDTLLTIHSIPNCPQPIFSARASILTFQNDLKSLSKILDFWSATSALLGSDSRLSFAAPS